MNHISQPEQDTPVTPRDRLAEAAQALDALDSYAPDERAYLGLVLASIAGSLLVLAEDALPAQAVPGEPAPAPARTCRKCGEFLELVRGRWFAVAYSSPHGATAWERCQGGGDHEPR